MLNIKLLIGMKKSIKILTVTILVLLSGISTRIFAQQGYWRQPGPAERERQIPGLLDLTEEQQEQITDLRTAYLKDIQPLKNELNINKAKLDALLTEDNPQVNEINNLIENNGKIQIEIRKKQVAHQLEIRKLLDDEQKVIFDSRPHRYLNRPYRNMRLTHSYHHYRHFR